MGNCHVSSIAIATADPGEMQRRWVFRSARACFHGLLSPYFSVMGFDDVSSLCMYAFNLTHKCDRNLGRTGMASADKLARAAPPSVSHSFHSLVHSPYSSAHRSIFSLFHFCRRCTCCFHCESPHRIAEREPSTQALSSGCVIQIQGGEGCPGFLSHPAACLWLALRLNQRHGLAWGPMIGQRIQCCCTG